MTASTDTISKGLKAGACYRHPEPRGLVQVTKVARQWSADRSSQTRTVWFRSLDPTTLAKVGITFKATDRCFAQQVAEVS